MVKVFNTVLTLSIIVFVVALLAIPWLLILIGPLFIVGAAPAVFLTLLIRRRRDGKFVRQIRERFKILVVDDDPMTVSPLIVALSDSRHEFNIVTSPHDMLAQLRSTPFNLLVIDRFMPEMNGDQALVAGDRDPQVPSGLPVVFFSASPEGLEPGSYNKFSVKDVWKKGTPMNELRARFDLVVAAAH